MVQCFQIRCKNNQKKMKYANFFMILYHIFAFLKKKQ